jgi:hypothetical protein
VSSVAGPPTSPPPHKPRCEHHQSSHLAGRLPLLRPSGAAPGPIGCDSVVNRTVEIHAWLLAALLVGALAMITLFLVMMHVHAVDVAYIAHTHRPVIVVPTGAPPVVAT